MQTRDGCEHPMIAGENSCRCQGCGETCNGQFEGCEAIWARGPRTPNVVTAGPSPLNEPVRLRTTSGAGPDTTLLEPPASANGAGPPRESSQQVLRWLDATFQGLREEVRDSTNSLSRQQARLPDLIQDIVDRSIDGRWRRLVQEAVGAGLEEPLDEIRKLAVLQREQGAVLRSLAGGPPNGDVADHLAALATELRALADEQSHSLREAHAEAKALGGAQSDALQEALAEMKAATASAQLQQDQSSALMSTIGVLTSTLDGNLADHLTALATELKALADEQSQSLREAHAEAKALGGAQSDALQEALAEMKAATASAQLQQHQASALMSTIGPLTSTLGGTAGQLTTTVTDLKALLGDQVQLGTRALEMVAEALDDTKGQVEALTQTQRVHIENLTEAEDVFASSMAELRTMTSDGLTQLQLLRSATHALSTSLEETRALANAQREDTELLDQAMSTLHGSLQDLQASTTRQRAESRNEMRAQWRSANDAISKQLLPVTEGLPELVTSALAAAIKENNERLYQRVRVSVTKQLQAFTVPIEASNRRLEEIIELVKPAGTRARKTADRRRGSGGLQL